ncbi:ribonuclease M5 [Terribacillus saccharophilus]|uniref:ribonuclease M5 n=1 Tax=Terribacillus saccharophilus TaxID=361277 RepID=UPI003981B47B
MQIKEVIVVEGKDDTAKINQAIQADTIETNGSAIHAGIIEQIKHAQEKRGVIIFTDPDYPGERIRHIVAQAVPGCKHAFLPKDKARARNNKGIGIEHATAESIRTALEQVYETSDTYVPEISREAVIAYGLLGGPKAKHRRTQLGERLAIGHTNGKQLLKRLAMFRISEQLFVETMQQIIQEENDDE